MMKFLSLEPFVPSGNDFAKAKDFFVELGFDLLWSDTNYADFQKDDCRFGLQNFNNTAFAQNFMITVRVTNADDFRNSVLEKKLPEKFGIRIGSVTEEPYGKEVNIIDMAGVCWHFVE